MVRQLALFDHLPSIFDTKFIFYWLEKINVSAVRLASSFIISFLSILGLYHVTYCICLVSVLWNRINGYVLVYLKCHTLHLKSAMSMYRYSSASDCRRTLIDIRMKGQLPICGVLAYPCNLCSHFRPDLSAPLTSE